MMNNPPIKRHSSLKNLSREHHDGLIFSLRLGKGIKNNVARERLEDYAKWFWKNHLTDHFKMEEQHLFPMIASRHPLIKKAIAQHRQLEGYFDQDSLSTTDLQIVADLVKRHIRLEERELFQYIQENVDESALAKFAEIHDVQQACPVWEDEFWK